LRYNKEDYIFASSCVRGKEKNLLDAKIITKMIGAKSKQEAIRALSDLGYAVEETTRTLDSAAVDAMLSLELSKTYQQVVSTLPDQRALDTLLLVYDYHNIKAIIKGELAETDPSDAIVDIGVFPRDILSQMIKEREFTIMPFMMKSAIQYAFENFAKTKDPQHIDFILDRACYLNMKAEAEKTGCAFLQDYVTLLIDAINVKTFARIREMKADWIAFNKVFLPGGKIAESIFVGGFEEDYSHFAEKLRPYHTFEDVMAKGGLQLSETGRFTELERLCDDAIIEFASRAKYVPYGLEVPAAYLIAKEGEIRLVRIILAAIDQGLTVEQLTSRLRRTYV
jgi:V/A-type H+/Na+-transporting ATPase subunit C